MREKRTKEHIQENIKLLESSLESTRSELHITRRIQNRIDSEYSRDPDVQMENDIILSALYCYITELNVQIRNIQNVIKTEKEKLKE